ncbi:uncharacterized protein [Solanum lycopersicum]|uniref:uncharacterized protein n=1 Tax=Solanum lycopersicum TaxID=4081 RepID=UPI003749B870
MAERRIQLVLVLNHFTGGTEKVNAVNYLTKPPPPADEYYYKEDTYEVNDETGVATRGGKQTVDPPIPSVVEDEMRKDKEVVETSDELVDKMMKEIEVPQKLVPFRRPPPPFPQRLVKNTEDGNYRRFITMLKQFCIIVPLIEALEQMPSYAKFMKDMVKKKRPICFEDDDRMQHCVSIHLMPLSIYKKLGLGYPKPTAMRLLMADRTVKKPIGILHDVLVEFEVPIILGRLFRSTGHAFVAMEKGKMKFRLNNEGATFNICRPMKQSDELQMVSAISY